MFIPFTAVHKRLMFVSHYQSIFLRCKLMFSEYHYIFVLNNYYFLYSGCTPSSKYSRLYS